MRTERAKGVAAVMLLLASAAALMAVAGCGQQSALSPHFEDPVGEWLGQSGCISRTEGGSVADTLDCLVLAYDGFGLLTMIHANAGFNCAPVIDAKVTVGPPPVGEEGLTGTISVEEREIWGYADCDCLMNLNYRVSELPPGRYLIVVDEEDDYLEPGDEPLECVADLIGVSTALECVERRHYPWGGFGASEGEGTGRRVR
jgi:hypothetical protein